MTVERNKDGSVTIRDKRGVSVIGKIANSCDDRYQERFQSWVEDCAKIVTPCEKTFEEMENYFLNHCNALPMLPDDRRMKNFQLNVIMNHCKDKLGFQPSQFSFDMTDEEIDKWHKEQEDIHEKAMNSSPESFDYKLRGYYLPQNENNTAFYEQDFSEIKRSKKNADYSQMHIDKQDICFFFEGTTEHFQSSGGGESLMQQMIVFRGISEEDIKNRTPRFLSYITTLRDLGELPCMNEEINY
jgi:hypothetical protein